MFICFDTQITHSIILDMNSLLSLLKVNDSIEPVNLLECTKFKCKQKVKKK